jgi:hypothetical protein
MAVAFNTWIRREALCVVGHVGIHHVLVKILTEVEYEMFEAELLGNPPGIVDIAHRATT